MRVLATYVRVVEALGYGIGRFAMLLLFVLMAVLLYGVIGRAGAAPPIWTDEMSQFLLLG